MKYRTSYGYINVINNNILEITPDEGAIISLEMVEETQGFINEHITQNFAMLINQINNYHYSYEAQLSVGSYANLTAIAFVYFSEQGQDMSKNLVKKRAIDNWNFQIFSGLDLGWQLALSWLQGELNK